MLSSARVKQMTKQQFSWSFFIPLEISRSIARSLQQQSLIGDIVLDRPPKSPSPALRKRVRCQLSDAGIRQATLEAQLLWQLSQDWDEGVIKVPPATNVHYQN